MVKYKKSFKRSFKLKRRFKKRLNKKMCVNHFLGIPVKKKIKVSYPVYAIYNNLGQTFYSFNASTTVAAGVLHKNPLLTMGTDTEYLAMTYDYSFFKICGMQYKFVKSYVESAVSTQANIFSSLPALYFDLVGTYTAIDSGIVASSSTTFEVMPLNHDANIKSKYYQMPKAVVGIQGYSAVGTESWIDVPAFIQSLATWGVTVTTVMGYLDAPNAMGGTAWAQQIGSLEINIYTLWGKPLKVRGGLPTMRMNHMVYQSLKEQGLLNERGEVKEMKEIKEVSTPKTLNPMTLDQDYYDYLRIKKLNK